MAWTIEVPKPPRPAKQSRKGRLPLCPDAAKYASDDERKTAFLELVAGIDSETGELSDELGLSAHTAAYRVGVDMFVVDNWRKDPDFEKDFQTAYEIGVDKEQSKLQDIAINGVAKYVTSKDGLCRIASKADPGLYEYAMQTEYSERLLQIYLKARRPLLFGDNNAAASNKSHEDADLFEKAEQPTANVKPDENEPKPFSPVL